MSRADRLQLIERLQTARGGRTVISYVTTTRANVEVMMRMDVIPIIHRHLLALHLDKRSAKVDLFLHTNGGESVVPWRLMTLLREYAHEVNLLVPHRAYSAGTLTALGADEVLMGPMGTLGPIDPTVTTPFNPANPQNSAQLLGISVEDVAAYFSLVKDDVGIHHEDELIQAFRVLAEKIHPLALGNIKRISAQSGMMAEKLLTSRRAELDPHAVTEIIDKLGSKLYFHGHPINRQEAQKHLNLKFVKDAPVEVEEAMWALYEAYSSEMKLDEEFLPVVEVVRDWNDPLPQPPAILPSGQVVPSSPAVRTVRVDPMKTVYVESAARTDVRELQVDITVTREFTGKVAATEVCIRSDHWLEEP